MIFNRLPSYSLVASKNIKTYDDLKGKKVGSTSGGASATKLLKDVLIDNKINPDKDVTIFYIGTTPAIYQALLSGAVDAGTLVAPNDVMAKEKGFTSLPFADKPGMLMGGVAASGKFLRDRPDVALRFMKATRQGLMTLLNDRASSVTVMAKTMKIDEKLAGEIYDNGITRYSQEGFEPDSFQDQALAFEFGDVKPGMRERAFDFSLVRKASGL
jgi:NitT/TauT family transport system substrate-binding protein